MFYTEEEKQELNKAMSELKAEGKKLWIYKLARLTLDKLNNFLIKISK